MSRHDSYRNVTFSGCFPTYKQQKSFKKTAGLLGVAVAVRLLSFLLDATRLYGPVGRRRRPAQISSAFEGQITKSLSYTQLSKLKIVQKSQKPAAAQLWLVARNLGSAFFVRNIGKQKKESASASMPYIMWYGIQGCVSLWRAACACGRFIHSPVTESIHPWIYESIVSLRRLVRRLVFWFIKRWGKYDARLHSQGLVLHHRCEYVCMRENEEDGAGHASKNNSLTITLYLNNFEYIYTYTHWCILAGPDTATVGTCFTYTYSPSIEVDKFNPCNLNVSFHDWRESRDLEDFTVSMTRNATLWFLGTTWQHQHFAEV